jgi:hypothetical protein
MKARRIVNGWLEWLRWSLCWDTDVARRCLERTGEAVGWKRRELS